MKRLAIFARAPVLGRVKTRLAKDVGDEAALAVYRELLALTLGRLGSPNDHFRAELWLEGESSELDELAPRLAVHRQPGGDLGERMAAAFADGVSALVGCDIPGIGAAYVRAALAALADADLVLGPTEDGGYCLVAMNEPHPEVFADIPWSTSAVLAATLDTARHLSVTLLDTLWDVDEAEDLTRWRRWCGASSGM